MSILPSLFQSAVNHLLAPEPWAREALRAHAGKVAAIDIGLFVLTAQVAPDGLLQTADGASADVTIRIAPADLPRVLADLERAVSYAKVEGDAEFANTISKLSQSLRWEPEDDLSRLVGDIAAMRIVSTARTAVQSVRDTQRSLAENIAEYLLDEKPTLVRPQSVADFSTDVVRLRDDVERLEKRLRKLEG